MEEFPGQGIQEELWSFHALSPNFHVFTNQKLLQTLSLGFFGRLHYVGVID